MSRVNVLHTVFSLILGCIVLAGAADANSQLAQKSPLKNIYDEKANARDDIKKAIVQAQKEGKRILLKFGGNWCPWCRRLHALFQENETIRTCLGSNFVLVLVDVGHRDKNADLNEKYGRPWSLGLPALVVLEKDGAMLHVQETGSLEFTPEDGEGKGHHPERVLHFLKTWAPQQVEKSH
ncbi:MAG: thioredoxin family protein [Candidatus Zhuqueibacterota bacterium]